MNKTKPIVAEYMKIDFINRYKSLCVKYNDYDNSLRGNWTEIYSSVFCELGYNVKYFKRETFYRFEEKLKDYRFVLQFVLKEGLVEAMIHPERNNTFCVPDGRFDFVAKEIDDSFDRRKYTLPDYTSKEELKLILKEIFSIYEDLKTELISNSDEN